MKALLLAAALVALLALPALAFWHGSAGGGCTNSLNFAQTCNSAYIAVIL